MKIHNKKKNLNKKKNTNIKMIYTFNEITQCYTNYDVQMQINYIQISNKYISIILKDINKQEIELIAFQKDMKKLKELKLELNKWYTLNNIQTIPNNIFKRTNHNFKLRFKSTLTKIKLIKTFKIVKNNKLFVEEIKKKKIKKENNNKKLNQLSIINFLNINNQ